MTRAEAFLKKHGVREDHDVLAKVNAVRAKTHPPKEPFSDLGPVMDAIADLQDVLKAMDPHDHKVVVMLNGTPLI